MGAIFDPFGTAADIVVNSSNEIAGDKIQLSLVNVLNKVMEPFFFFPIDRNLVNRISVKRNADRSIGVFYLENIATVIDFRDILTAFDHLNDDIYGVLLGSAFWPRHPQIWHQPRNHSHI